MMILFLILSMTAGCELVASCEDVSSHVFVMGTVFEVRAIGNDVQPALTKAEELLYDCDQLISWRQDGSLTYAFNQTHEQDMTTIDAMIAEALQISEDSEGAFDMTVLPLSEVWDFDRFGEADFDPESASVPDAALIEEALAKVDYRKLSYDPGTHMLSTEDNDVQIELGAIGKGYAADKAMALLKDEGVTGAMINAGSTISVTGHKSDGSDFHVAVRNPRGEADDYIGVLSLTDLSIATSGDYERYFEENGVRYHHILDPKTGYPADSGLIQVTIICDSGMLADALSTACFVLGLDKGMALAESYGAMALMVDQDRQVWYNNGAILDLLDFSGEEQGFTLRSYE